MRYSLEPTYRRYVKRYGFRSSARKFRDKHDKNLMNTAKKNKELILLKQLVQK